jgi:hypothetical protein
MRMNETALLSLRRTLEDIRAKVVGHPAFLKGSGSLPDGKSFVKDRDTIRALQSRLSVALQLLHNDLANLDFRAQIASRAPREHRYRAQQSVRDKTARVQDVYELAVNVEAELRGLRDKNDTVSVIDMMGKLVKGTNELAVAIVAKHKGHYDALKTDGAIAANIPMAFILAVLIGYLAIAGSEKKA